MYGRAEPRKPFRSIVADQIVSSLTASIGEQSPEKVGNNVLVVDDYALAIINAAVSQPDLVKAGFITVCPFETKRQAADGKHRRPYPGLDAVYFMRPRKANLQRILEDYRSEVPDRKPDIFERFFPCIFRGIPTVDDKPPMYADFRLLILPGARRVEKNKTPQNWQLAHAFLSNAAEVEGAALARLTKAWKRDGAATECPCEIMAYEPCLFSLDTPDTLSTVYTHALAAGVLDGEELKDAQNGVYDHLDTVAYRLMTALVTLNEAPSIRCSTSSGGAAEIVARSLAKQLKAYREDHPDFTPWCDPEAVAAGGGRDRRPGAPPEPATLFVVDRVDDLAPALLHDITYCSLVVDLMGHEPSTPFHFTYTKGGATVERDVVLDDTDPVWRNVRYDDMPTVIDTVDNGVRAANARYDARQALDRSQVGDMRKLMAALTTDEKLVDEKFAQHYRIKNQIVEIFERRAMQDLCTLEQMLVTGCDGGGERPSAKEIERRLRTLMQDERLTDEDQARLLALYILCAKSVEVKTRNELLALSRISKRNQAAVLNLTNLHVPIQRTASEARGEGAPFHDEETLKRNRKLAAETTKLCRYVTKVEDVLRYHIKGTLPDDQYPWIRRGAMGAGKLIGGGSSAAGGGAGEPVPLSVAISGHGEVRYTAQALDTAPDRGVVPNAKSKKSRFAASADVAGAEGGAGGAAGGVGGAAAGGGGGEGGAKKPAADDPYSRFLEPPRPRAYEGGRLIVFFVGGITQMEIAALERLSKETGREIIYGGTSLITPRDTLEELYATEPAVEDDDVDAGGGVFPSVEDF